MHDLKDSNQKEVLIQEKKKRFQLILNKCFFQDNIKVWISMQFVHPSHVASNLRIPFYYQQFSCSLIFLVFGQDWGNNKMSQLRFKVSFTRDSCYIFSKFWKEGQDERMETSLTNKNKPQPSAKTKKITKHLIYSHQEGDETKKSFQRQDWICGWKGWKRE